MVITFLNYLSGRTTRIGTNATRSLLKGFRKPSERASYIVPTETFKSKYRGVTDTPSIAKLNMELIPGIAPTQSKSGQASEAQSSESVVPISMNFSTKSPVPDHMCHTSDVKRDRVTDLTELDQDNRECFEQCDRMQCPMYKKLFFKANTQDTVEMHACPRVGIREENTGGAKTNKSVKIAMASGRVIHEDDASAAEMTSKDVSIHLGSIKQRYDAISGREYGKSFSKEDHNKDVVFGGRSSNRDYAGLPPNQPQKGNKQPSKPSNAYSCYGNGTEKYQANVCPGLDDSVNLRTMNTERYLCFSHKYSEPGLVKSPPQGTEFSTSKNAKQVGPECPSCPYVSVFDPDIQKSLQKSSAKKEEYSSQTKQLPSDVKKFPLNNGKIIAAAIMAQNNSKDEIFCCKNSLEDSLPARFKESEVSAQFAQDDESSATFRKVFAVDGVALKCQCCVSSFKYSKEK